MRIRFWEMGRNEMPENQPRMGISPRLRSHHQFSARHQKTGKPRFYANYPEGSA